MDNTVRLEKIDKEIMDIIKNKKTIAVINKIDLPRKLDLDEASRHLNGAKTVELSAARGTNLDILEKAIAQLIWGGEVLSTHETLIANLRHAEAIRKAYRAMEGARKSLGEGLSAEFVAVDVKEALFALGEITGETITDDLLERIFGEFCIGK
jgi:tRNA modification GTPase